MNNFFINLFAGMGSAFISSIIFTEIKKKYNFSKWIKLKLRINSKFKSIFFYVLIFTIINAITLRFTSSTTVYYYAIEGFFLGVILLFI